jgi:proteasome lid subunit RPN8/RPN11
MNGEGRRHPQYPEAPWVLGALTIDAGVLAEVEAHALAEYPSEACGLLFGPAADPARVDGARREVNEADRYHRLDPQRFPRTSRTYFKMNELHALRSFDEGARAGRPVKVVYHSHCDAGAYFSAEDAATFAPEGALAWPAAFLVVSVVGDGEGGAPRVADRRLWVHEPDTGTFRESPFTVCAPA